MRRSTSSTSSITFLHAGRQIRAASAERDSQAAVDDPDVLNLCIDEIWQESVQREHESRRPLVANQIAREAVAHQSEEKLRDRNGAEGRDGPKRNANFASASEDLADLDLEGDAAEFPH